MKNHHVTDRLPEYLMNETDLMSRSEIEEHLNTCAVCREEYEGLLKLWAKLGTIPEEKPGANLRARFYSMLEAYEEGLKNARPRPGLSRTFEFLERLWPKQPLLQVGLTLAVLVLGFAVGTQVKVGKEPQPYQQEEVAQLRDEVRNMGRLLTISLLQQQSASERLRGVSWSYQMEQPDQQVVSALVRALKFDSNVNVRLAAIDALEKFVDDPGVRREIVDALPGQNSPLVQIALVDLMIDQRIKQSADALKKMSRDPEIDPTVKKRIEEGMKELSL